MNAALFAMSLLVAGCELIANIPSSTALDHDGGGSGSGSDGGGGDDDAMIDAKVGCDVDSECASGVCLLDRTCAMESRILHAAPAGTGAACTVAAPCSVETAVSRVATGLDVIKLAAGTYERTAQLDVATTVTFAGTGAVWHGTAGQTFYGHLNITAGVVTIIGIDFDLNGTLAIMCPSGAFVLSRAKVRNGVYGIYASGTCTGTIDRTSFVANNFYGAYFAMGTQATITNSYFVDHAPTLDSLAALIFEGATGTVSHTTFSNPAAMAAAIHCTSSPNLKMTSLIAFGHGASPSVEPGCDVSYSVLDPGYTGPGQNNVTTNPMFIGGGNYHLSPASPVRALGDPASTMAHDGDGEPRPQPAGSRVDPGADEVP